MATNCWPTENQELLLRACLMNGHEALTAWQQWRVVFESEAIDEGSRRLLPLLYRNLKNQKITDPFISMLKEEYFHTWSENQFCLGLVASLIAASDITYLSSCSRSLLARQYPAIRCRILAAASAEEFTSSYQLVR